MLDPILNPLSQQILKPFAAWLVARNVSADQVTLSGFVIGLLAVPALAFEQYTLALLFILLNRFSDGLDGAVARATRTTDAGGYLDIVLDFIFYSAVILGFLLANPAQNAVAAGVLLVTFMGTGATFLAFAAIAAKRGIDNLQYPNKSLHYMGGLTEGFETIVTFVLFCLWPAQFPLLAGVFAAACWITAVTRLYSGYQMIRPDQTKQYKQEN